MSYVRDNVSSLSKNKSRWDEQVLFRPEGIYFTLMTAGLYIIPLIIRLLAKTREDIPPKYLFLMILLPFRDFR